MKARWMTPSAAESGFPEAVQVVQVGAAHGGADGCQGGSLSDRARPTTSCPAWNSSGMTAERVAGCAGNEDMHE